MMWIEAVYFLFWSDVVYRFLKGDRECATQHFHMFHTIQMILSNPFNTTL